MQTGRVKFFDLARGYGFIVPDAGGQDLFVHVHLLTEPVSSGLRRDRPCGSR